MSSLSHSLSLWKGLKPTNLLPLGCCRATNWPRHTCHWSYDHHTEIQHPEKFPQIYLECEWASVCVCYCRKVTKSNAKWSDQCIVRLIMEKKNYFLKDCALSFCVFLHGYILSVAWSVCRLFHGDTKKSFHQSWSKYSWGKDTHTT